MGRAEFWSALAFYQTAAYFLAGDKVPLSRFGRILSSPPCIGHLRRIPTTPGFFFVRLFHPLFRNRPGADLSLPIPKAHTPAHRPPAFQCQLGPRPPPGPRLSYCQSARPSGSVRCPPFSFFLSWSGGRTMVHPPTFLLGGKRLPFLPLGFRGFESVSLVLSRTFRRIPFFFLGVMEDILILAHVVVFFLKFLIVEYRPRSPLSLLSLLAPPRQLDPVPCPQAKLPVLPAAGFCGPIQFDQVDVLNLHYPPKHGALLYLAESCWGPLFPVASRCFVGVWCLV